MRCILITGTPGTGKTTVARKIAKKLKARYLDVNKVISKYKLSIGYDKERKSKVIDVSKLKKTLSEIIRESKEDIVIDSHLSHYVDSRLVDTCIVTKCDINVLKKRLRKRGYHKAKIRENLDAEIFDICLMEALALGHKVKVIDTSKGLKGLKL